MSRDVLGVIATIVAAHFRHNETPTDALPGLIQSVYRSLVTAGSPETMSRAALIPAVPIKRSVFPDYIVCLEDGQKFKTLIPHPGDQNPCAQSRMPIDMIVHGRAPHLEESSNWPCRTCAMTGLGLNNTTSGNVRYSVLVDALGRLR